ncbi:MAG TPA: hypothetical protein VHX60_17300 [Acidobacteriaceae bacterium]|jgi:hypothetical protein|nr:hypothetical protein [Acidobacteriaceae bacterium]
MKKSLRFLTVFATLTLCAGSLFADGPGGSDPPPPVSTATQSAATGANTMGAALAALLACLG